MGYVWLWGGKDRDVPPISFSHDSGYGLLDTKISYFKDTNRSRYDTVYFQQLARCRWFGPALSLRKVCSDAIGWLGCGHAPSVYSPRYHRSQCIHLKRSQDVHTKLVRWWWPRKPSENARKRPRKTSENTSPATRPSGDWRTWDKIRKRGSGGC